MSRWCWSTHMCRWCRSIHMRRWCWPTHMCRWCRSPHMCRCCWSTHMCGWYLSTHMCRWCWSTQCVDYGWQCHRRCWETRLLKSTVLAPGFLMKRSHRINRHSIGHRLHLATYLYSSSHQGLYFLLAQLLLSSRDIEGEVHTVLWVWLAWLSIAGKFTTQSHRWT